VSLSKETRGIVNQTVEGVWGNDLKGISIRLSFLNPRIVPVLIGSNFKIEPESSSMAKKRGNRNNQASTGMRIVDPREPADILDFLTGPLDKDYALVKVEYQPRLIVNGSRIGQYFYMIRFEFVRKGLAQPQALVGRLRNSILRALLKLVQDASWRVRVFLNPEFVDGRETDCNVLSVNLEHRQPRIEPKYTLRVEGGNLVLGRM